MADVFISYSRRDLEVARAVLGRLREANYSIFIDEELESGRRFDDALKAEIDRAKIVLVLWSERSVDSIFVLGEARRAEKKKKLMAARLDACELPLDLGEVHTTDLRGLRAGEHHEGLERLLAQLRQRVAPHSPSEVESLVEAMRKLRKRVREAATSGVLAALVAFASVVGLAAGVPGWVPRWRMVSLQARASAVPYSPTEELRVVAIDADTERRLSGRHLDAACTHGGCQMAGGFGPFWRMFHARVLDQLSRAGARVIALDIMFSAVPAGADASLLRGASVELATAIRRARARGTAVFAVDSAPQGVEPEIANALRSSEPTLGGLVHGCMGSVEGGASLVPIMLTDEAPSAALSSSSVAALERAQPAWDAKARRVLFVRTGRADAVPYTGESAPLAVPDPGCGVMRVGQRAAMRILDPFPSELGRGQPRVIPYEDVLTDEQWDGSPVKDKLVLVGRLAANVDRHRVCASWTCGELSGLSLQAAAIDTLMRPQAIGVLRPAWQLAWIAGLCILVGVSRFASAGSAPWRRFGELAVLIALDTGLSIFLAIHHALLVDTLHHGAAMLVVYRFVSWCEPSRYQGGR